MIKTSHVLVCAGSGGVGKTTCAAAIGVRAAQLGLRALVLTVDPAQRLATALGLDLKSRDDRVVPLSAVTGTLAAAVIDSKSVFDGFIKTHSQEAEFVTRIMKNRLYQQLSTTLSGSQEFTAVERLLQATESGRYDLVVLDTPPTKHAVDFFTAPVRINALFQDSITRWFMAPGMRSPGLFASLLSRGTRVALKSLETLTGGAFIEELLDFFAAIRSIQSVLQERSQAAHRLLLDRKTRFVIVTSFDQAKLLEAQYLKKELQKLGYQFEAVVINRAFPIGLPVGPPAADSVDSGDVSAEILEKAGKLYKTFQEYYGFRYRLYADFARDLGQDVVITRVPEYQKDVYGMADLTALAQVLGQGVRE